MLAVKAASSTASRSCGWAAVNVVAHGPLLTAQPMQGSACSAGAQSHGDSSLGPMSAHPTLQEEASLLVALVLEEDPRGSPSAQPRRWGEGGRGPSATGPGTHCTCACAAALPLLLPLLMGASLAGAWTASPSGRAAAASSAAAPVCSALARLAAWELLLCLRFSSGRPQRAGPMSATRTVLSTTSLEGASVSWVHAVPTGPAWKAKARA